MLLPSVSNQKLESQLFSLHVKARINLRSTIVQILQKWGSCPSLPSDKTPGLCISRLFSSLHISGGEALFLPTSRDIFSREKNTAAVTLDVIAERKEICLAIHILYEVFVWKMKTPKTSARFFTGKWIHSSFLSHKWLFFFSSVLCLFFACWYLFLVDMSVFVLCLLCFFDVFCPFVLCLCRCLVFACRFKPMTLVFCM